MELHRATIEEDAELLGPWEKAFAAICGEGVSLAPLNVDDPSTGLRMTFPRVFKPIELIGGIGHFRERPALVEHVRRMGFSWDDDGRVMSMAAPGAFNARLAAVGFPDAGFTLAYANGAPSAAPLAAWLLRYVHGVITLLVYAPAYYEELLQPGSAPHVRGDARWGLLSLAHDLSVHALNYHLVPHSALVDLAARIRAAVPDRYATWSQAGSITPLTLTYFYDNDFNRYTYAVWCCCERPQDFAPVFSAKHNFEQLVAALDVRLTETKAGRGDVASGDFDEVGKLAETSFELR